MYWNQSSKSTSQIQGKDQEVRKSNVAFKFGDIVHKYLGSMQVSIPTPNGENIIFSCDIVRADIPQD